MHRICKYCNENPVPEGVRGRPPEFCSDECRKLQNKRSYEKHLASRRPVHAKSNKKLTQTEKRKMQSISNKKQYQKRQQQKKADKELIQELQKELSRLEELLRKQQKTNSEEQS